MARISPYGAIHSVNIHKDLNVIQMYSLVEIEEMINDETSPKGVSVMDLEHLARTLYANFSDKTVLLSWKQDQLYQKLHKLSYFVYPSEFKFDMFDIHLTKTL